MVLNLQKALLNLGMHHCHVGLLSIAMFLSFFRNCHPKTLKINVALLVCSVCLPSTVLKIVLVLEMLVSVIPILVSMLSTTDVSTQEHVVTALLNLSIYEENKARIISSGAVPGIVHVLKRGSMEARDNSAATLSSLSIVDENKVIIGASGAIPALVQLLSNGSQWGKMDAATALFNLCIYQGNKGKAVRAGLVPILLELLMETESGMVDLALATLAILSSHPEGTRAIGAASAIPVLVRVIRNGSPRNKENAAAVIVDLCICNGEGEQQQQHLAEAQEQGIVSWLEELAESGTDRGKSKAVQLLLRMSQFLKQQSQAQA